MKYVYRNRQGHIVFKPVYDRYNELFTSEVIERSGIKVSFGELKDTGIYERYMANVAQFSAAKNMAETRLLQDAVFGPNGNVKSYQQFEKDAKEITDIQQKTWLRVEYETCRRQASSGAEFSRMIDNKDLYPYWVYKGRMDARERIEHVEMEGKVFEIGDKNGDACYPPIDWNCRCRGIPIDGQYLAENGVSVLTSAESAQYLMDNVDPQFRYNAATQGPMPNDHSYFDIFPDANAGNASTFGLDLGGDIEFSAFTSRHGMHYLVDTVHSWKDSRPHDDRGNLIFQNRRLYTNVRLGDLAIHRISKHSRGIENLPKTIEHPTEVWTYWKDREEQRATCRNYLKMGHKVSYCVQTTDGIVTDAFVVSRTGANKYRHGVIL